MPPNRAAYFAEAGGFEPPVRLLVRQFSKLLVSATHPNFRRIFLKIARKYTSLFSAYQRKFNFL